MATGLMERFRTHLSDRKWARRCAKDHQGNALAFIKTYYHRYRNSLAARIDDILRYDEADVPGMVQGQEEHALPGMSRYVATGYHEFMLGRYLFALRYVRGKRVLDSGCGLGWGSYLICDHPAALLSVDNDPEALRFCRDTWRDDRLDFQ